MPWPMLVECDQHGSPYCYLQRDGSHISPSVCCCKQDGKQYSERCPIDLHREGARFNPPDRSKPILPTAQSPSKPLEAG
jgi:hypothetical protein